MYSFLLMVKLYYINIYLSIDKIEKNIKMGKEKRAEALWSYLDVKLTFVGTVLISDVVNIVAKSVEFFI